MVAGIETFNRARILELRQFSWKRITSLRWDGRIGTNPGPLLGLVMCISREVPKFAWRLKVVQKVLSESKTRPLKSGRQSDLLVKTKQPFFDGVLAKAPKPAHFPKGPKTAPKSDAHFQGCPSVILERFVFQ